MDERPAATRPAVALAMLLLVYVFNFLDRQILAILAAPIQRDLALSDTQMGLLGGLAFALLYSTLGVPLAALADRTSRSWVIAGSLAVWSGFTALCAAAQGFWHIFLARVGVGIGEAGGVAPSYALIGDYFPSERRARALAVYSLGIPLGSALGVLAGGYLAAKVDWRAAFLVVGLAGLAVAPLFKALVRDRAQPADNARPAIAFGTTARLLARKRAFWLLAFGAASCSMMGYGIAFWLPSLLQRSFGLSLVQASQFYGALLLIGGVSGVLGAGWLADRLQHRDKAWVAFLPAIAFVISAPLWAAGIAAPNATLGFLLLVVPQGLSYVWLPPVLTAVQHLVPTATRSVASALFLLILNLIGLGGGIYALGALSDWLKPTYGAEALRYSMLFALSLYLLAAGLMAAAGPPLRREWISEPQAG